MEKQRENKGKLGLGKKGKLEMWERGEIRKK